MLFGTFVTLDSPLSTSSSPCVFPTLRASGPIVPDPGISWLRDASSTKSPCRVIEGNLSAEPLLKSTNGGLSGLDMLSFGGV